MSAAETIQETYRARLEVDACYTALSEATQQYLESDVRRYGLRRFDRVAHGVLVFCIEEDSPICVPWLISPDAPERDLIGGRHGLVMGEFYPVADREKLKSYSKIAFRGVDYDDFIGTYVIKDMANEAPFTVICDSGETSRTTPDQVELISHLSRKMSDHQIVIGAGGELTTSSYMKIRNGQKTELQYGFQRGLDLNTVAASDDIVGKARELENYAKYAQKHGLKQWEFNYLTEKAVGAFRAGRQVGLDELCQEIIAEREQAICE